MKMKGEGHDLESVGDVDKEAVDGDEDEGGPGGK